MKCPSCGLTVPDSANFCNHCGAAISVQGQVANASASAPQNAGTDTSASYIMSPPPDQKEERILWDEYPSMRTAIPGIVSWVFGGIAVILAVKFLAPQVEGLAAIVVIAVVAAIVIGVLIKYYIRYHSTKYRLSSQRIFITHGLFNKRTDEVELEKYKDVFVNQDFWDKLVGCGDIEVVTGDATHPAIKIIDITDPIGKKEMIRAAARERKSGLGITRREEL